MADGGTMKAERAVTPIGLNHVVLNVSDMESSHRFWTEVLGFRLVGALKREGAPKMQFYSGEQDGDLSHHDIALVERKDLLDAAAAGGAPALNHVAVQVADREAFVAQLSWLQRNGVKFGARINHGTTHSVYFHDPDGHGVEICYELPRAVWAGDIDAAVNWSERVPTEGEAALEDREDVPTFSG